MKYEKPKMEQYTEEEMMNLISAGAACPNCYKCGTFTINT